MAMALFDNIQEDNSVLFNRSSTISGYGIIFYPMYSVYKTNQYDKHAATSWGSHAQEAGSDGDLYSSTIEIRPHM